MKNLWLAVGLAALMLGSACNRQGKTDNIDIIQSYVSKGEVIVADSLPVTLPIEQGCGRVVIRKASCQVTLSWSVNIPAITYPWRALPVKEGA